MAYESTTLAEIYRQIVQDLDCGVYVPNAKLDTVIAGSFTSADIFQDSGKGSGFYRDLSAGVYRGGSATSADNWRMLGDLTNSSGLIANAGAVWADTTKGTENFLVSFHGIRPDLDWLPLINQVLQEEFFTTTIGLSHGSMNDYDMSDPLAANWTTVGVSSAKTKSTTASRTPYGMKSLQFTTATTANSGVRSAAVPIGSSRYFNAFTIASVNVGTASFQAYDATNSATTGMPAAVTTTQVEPQLMVIHGQAVPATCKSIALNLLNTSATGDTYWNQAWIYNLDDMVINLPSYVSERFKAPSVYQLVPRIQTGNFTWDAQGVVPLPLTEGQDYSLVSHHADANPYQVIFKSRDAYNWPLFIEAKRPWYDIVASGAGFTGDPDTFGGAIRTLMPKIELRLLDKLYLPRLGAKSPKWALLRQQIAEEMLNANAARVFKPMAGARPYWGGFGHV